MTLVENPNDYDVQIAYIDELAETYRNSEEFLSCDIAILEAISENLFRLKGLDK